MSFRAFLTTRYANRFQCREEIARHQSHQFARFRRRVMPRAPFYRACANTPLAELPLVNTARLKTHFNAINTCGIDRDHAMEVALAAERSRDFSHQIGDVAVGLSTGISGQRGLFLASARERTLWAAILAGLS